MQKDTTLSVPAASGLLKGATDPDGNPLSISGFTVPGIAGTQAVGTPVTLAGKGDLTINADGSYTFTPVTGYTGAIPVVTYTVADGKGGIDTSTLALAINQPPVATPATLTTPEDTPVPVNFAGSDVDGTVTAVTALPSASAGVLYMPDGVTPVVANTALTPAEAASLVSKPAPERSGIFEWFWLLVDRHAPNRAAHRGE